MKAGWLLFLLVLAQGSQAAASQRDGRSPSLFPAGCFANYERGAPIYTLSIDHPEAPARFRYPASCDVGNWNKQPNRWAGALNLQASVDNGLCYSFEEWVDRDPFHVTKFRLFLSLHATVRDLRPLMAARSGQDGSFTLGPQTNVGLRPLTFAAGEDDYDRWVRKDIDGRIVELLQCRKAGAVASPDCDHHLIEGSARLSLAYKRKHRGRADVIRGYAQKLLSCSRDVTPD